MGIQAAFMKDKIETRIQIDETTKQELMSDDLIDYVVKVSGKDYTLESYVAAGYKAVVWKGRDKWDIPVAIKFAITEDYMSRSYHQEAYKAKKLFGYPRFANFIDAQVVELPIGSNNNKFVCFVEEWINGNTLEVYLNEGKFSFSFLLEFVRMMSEALAVLYHHNLCHDDLHARNIIISPPKP